MNKQEQNALRILSVATNPDAVRTIMNNARAKKSEVVEKAALRRLLAISTKFEQGTIEHDCWSMVLTIEEIRRASGRKVSRMHRMRPKISKDGEVEALAYCALNHTPGFDEVLSYGLPDLTAEAIVLRHRDRFAEEVVTAATARLEKAGFRVESSRQLVSTK